MSVYYKENAEYLRLAMNSIWNQTVKTNNFVLICDGPLNNELYSVIDEMQLTHPELIVLKLKNNRGLGRALNIGIKYCTNELVARMDSDDISRPYRCEKQLEAFANNCDLSIVSGIVEEFSNSTNDVYARRVLPEKQDEIIEYAKKRNPFNHPCVMYKKSAVEQAGGYQDFYLLEDYFLWVRMLQMGFIGTNLQEPLLWMRAGSSMYKRRSGWNYAKSQIKLFDYMKKTAFIDGNQYFFGVLTRCISSLLPNCLRRYMYISILRD